MLVIDVLKGSIRNAEVHTLSPCCSFPALHDNIMTRPYSIMKAYNYNIFFESATDAPRTKTSPTHTPRMIHPVSRLLFSWPIAYAKRATTKAPIAYANTTRGMALKMACCQSKLYFIHDHDIKEKRFPYNWVLNACSSTTMFPLIRRNKTGHDTRYGAKGRNYCCNFGYAVKIRECQHHEIRN